MVEDLTCAREGGHVITVISDCGEAVVFQIRTNPSPSLLFRYYGKRCIQKGTRRVTLPISIFETFRGARGSLNRVPLVYYRHVAWFTTAKGRKAVWRSGWCRIEQTENEMKDRNSKKRKKRVEDGIRGVGASALAPRAL